jgi:hypothetical protein
MSNCCSQLTWKLSPCSTYGLPTTVLPVVMNGVVYTPAPPIGQLHQQYAAGSNDSVIIRSQVYASYVFLGPTLSINTYQQHQHPSRAEGSSQDSMHYGQEIDRGWVNFRSNTLGRFNASVIVRSLGLLLLFPSPSNSMNLSPVWSRPGPRPHPLGLQPLPF